MVKMDIMHLKEEMGKFFIIMKKLLNYIILDIPKNKFPKKQDVVHVLFLKY